MPRRTLPPLEPQTIDPLFNDWGKSRRLGVRTARNRALAIGLLAITSVVVIAFFEGELIGQLELPSAVSVIAGRTEFAGVVELPLLHDPVGIVLVVVAFITPLFCAEQVVAMQLYVRKNVANGGVQYLTENQRQDVYEAIGKANQRFRLIGGWWSSLATATLSAGVTVLIMYAARTDGIYSAWNTTDVSNQVWSRAVYDNWWANRSVSQPLWCSQAIAGMYMTYYLVKQLLLGFVFALFARRAALSGFGVTQRPLHNIDGYWGLRWLRRFMQWTYVSTFCHLILAMGIFLVWLPVGPGSFLEITAVIAAAITVVVYPSSIAYNSSVLGKTQASRAILTTERPLDVRNGRTIDADAAVAALWERPHLPFKVRNTVTAALVYVVAPLGLLLLSNLIGAG